MLFLAIAMIGAIGFALYVVTVRDASQIPLLAAGAAVLGIVFLALAAYMLRSTWKAGVAARNGRRCCSGIGGGIAAYHRDAVPGRGVHRLPAVTHAQPG